jgi:hypothetical protein
MPLSPNRKLIQISDKAYEHLLRIKKARKRLGLSSSITGYASDLILSQPIKPAHWVGEAPQPSPVNEQGGQQA